MPKNINSIELERILGSRSQFPLQHQLFNAVTLCAAIICALLSISDFSLGLGPQYYLFSILAFLGFSGLYGYSRSGANFHKVIIPYILLCGIIMVYIWNMLGGFSRSLPLITLGIFITIPMITNGWQRFIASISLMAGYTLLFLLEVISPGQHPIDSESISELSDVFACTVVLGMGCSLGITFLMKNFQAQENKLHDLNQSLLKANDQLFNKIEELEKAASEIKQLNDLLPICSVCKKIRDDEGYWNEVERYFEARTHAEFSHGICPNCAARVYPKYYQPPEDDEADRAAT